MAHAEHFDIRSRPTTLLYAFIIGIAVFAVRLALRATTPTEWDSALLLQGVDHFDVMHMSPHPPGSFLYVQLGHLLHSVFAVPRVTALVVLAALASSATASIAFVIGNALRNKWLGLILALTITVNPVTAFYGSIVATYSFDLLGCTALIALSLYARRFWWTAPLAIALVALAAGFRTNAIVFDLPAALFVVWRSRPDKRTLFISAIAGAVSLLFWLIPLSLTQPGGLTTWREASNVIFAEAIHSTSLFYAPHDNAIRNIGVATAYAAITLIPLIPALIVGIIGRFINRARFSSTEIDTLIGCALVGIPAFTFASLGHWGKAGYLLMFLPALVIPIGVLWSKLSTTWFSVSAFCILAACALQTQRFIGGAGILPTSLASQNIWFTQQRFWAPFPETLTARHAAEKQTKDVALAISAVHPNPNDRLIMLDGDNGDRFAHVAWYFPETEADFVRVPGFWNMAAKHHSWNVQRPGPPSISVDGVSNIWVVTKSDREDLQKLVHQNQAERVSSTNDVRIWRLMPCTRLANVDLTADQCS